MKKACWIFFAAAYVIGCGLFPWYQHPRAALMFEDISIFLLGTWLGLILAYLKK